MRKSGEVLERLNQFPIAMETDMLARPVDGKLILVDMISTVERIVQSAPRGAKLPSLDTVKECRDEWRMGGYTFDALSRRAKRVLCGDPETAPTPEFISGIHGSGELRSQRRWIELLINTYYRTWGKLIHQDRFTTLVSNAVTGYQGRSKILEICRPVAAKLFSPGAAAVLAGEALPGRQQVRDVLDRFQVPLDSALAIATAEAAVNGWCVEFEQRRSAWSASDALSSFKYLADTLLPGRAHLGKTAEFEGPVASRETFGRAVGAVILWDRITAFDDVLEHLVELVRTHPWLGDPRLPNNTPNWAICPAGARERIIGLQARRDLAFFFDFVIPDGGDPHGRKKFWLQFVDRVEDSQVVLSAEDAARLRARVTEEYAFARIWRDSGAPAGVSAFLMRFREAPELIFIEFSEPGNALYIHDSKKFHEHTKNGLRASRFYFAFGLKSTTSVREKVRHYPPGTWQAKVRGMLARYGIRPV